jgi:hypothetical protein
MARERIFYADVGPEDGPMPAAGGYSAVSVFDATE